MELQSELNKYGLKFIWAVSVNKAIDIKINSQYFNHYRQSLELKFACSYLFRLNGKIGIHEVHGSKKTLSVCLINKCLFYF